MFQLITPSAPGAMLNEVVLSELEPRDTDRVIAEVIAMYAATAHPVKWWVGPWTKPAGFGPRLTSLGFASWAVRGMTCDTSRIQRPAEGVAVDEVSEAELDAYVDAAIRGWSLPPEQAAVERQTCLRALRASPRHAHFFVARIAAELAATAAVVVIDNHGYLLATQVLPAFRGRGVYRALVGARLAFLAQRGITLAVTHAREATSGPILEHLGFETVFRSECYLREPTVRSP